MLSKNHIFLVGEPGVGKTYIINIALRALKEVKYFEYLIMGHTKPEEIFGTMIVNDDGTVFYDTENSILDSHFVMMDEMYKGHSEILNSMLGVTSNERIFHMRGRGTVKVPLLTLFSASNEFPSDQSLNAFDDRIPVRYRVERIKDPDNYRRYLKGDFDKSKDVSVELSIDDIHHISYCAQNIEISDDIVNIYGELKRRILQDRVKMSDRKMLTALNILKVSAYLNNRDFLNYSDFFLMFHIAWRNDNEKRKIEEILIQLLYGDKQEVDSELAKYSNHLDLLKNIYETDIELFLYKRINIDTKSIEADFKSHLESLNSFSSQVTKLLRLIEAIEKMYSVNLSIEKMIQENIFIADYDQEVFVEDNLKIIATLKDTVVNYSWAIATFKEHCPDSYAYMQFRPNSVL
jgi:MoxR-like ATPase